MRTLLAILTFGTLATPALAKRQSQPKPSAEWAIRQAIGRQQSQQFGTVDPDLYGWTLTTHKDKRGVQRFHAWRTDPRRPADNIQTLAGSYRIKGNKVDVRHGRIERKTAF